MIKPITLTLLFTVCELHSCLAYQATSSSSPFPPIVKYSIPAYRKASYKKLMMAFVPVSYIRKKLSRVLNKYEEVAEITAYFNDMYGREKVVSILQFQTTLQGYPKHEYYKFVLDMLFSSDLIFNIIYLYGGNLTSFILFFTKQVVNFPVPSDIIWSIRRFLVCLSYEKDIKFGVHYYDYPKPCKKQWGVALLEKVLNTHSHFWMIHYQNDHNEEELLPTSQLKVKIYEPTQKYHHFSKRKITTKTLTSFELKKNFSFFKPELLQNLFLIGLYPKNYLFLNSLGQRFQYKHNKIEYGIVNNNKMANGLMGTRYFWTDIASHHSQTKVHMLGATCKGIAVKTFDCHFNSFFPSQHTRNLMCNYSFYKVFTNKNNAHVWGLSDMHIRSYHGDYEQHSAALRFDLSKERNTSEFISKSQNPFSYLDISGDLVAFSKYEELTLKLLDQRVPFDQGVTTYSLENMVTSCFIRSVHFLSDPKYILAKCKNVSYLIDTRYPTPVLDIMSFSNDGKVFLKDYNLFTSINYGIDKIKINYTSLDEIN